MAVAKNNLSENNLVGNLEFENGVSAHIEFEDSNKDKESLIDDFETMCGYSREEAERAANMVIEFYEI